MLRVLALFVVVLSVASAAEKEQDLLKTILAANAGNDRVSGKLEYQNATYDEGEETLAALFKADFWLAVPGKYHVKSWQSGEATSYNRFVSDGATYWKVQIDDDDVFNDPPKPVAAEDPFLTYINLIRLDLPTINQDFALSAESLTAAPSWLTAAKASVQLTPQSPRMQADAQAVTVFVDDKHAVAGFLVVDHHGNHMRFKLIDVDFQAAVPDALFADPRVEK
jgi:outer membrane lipoprotein-sorting protein